MEEGMIWGLSENFWICKNVNAQLNILINWLRARHYIFEIFSFSLIRLQRLNDLSSTNDSIVPTIPFAFTPDFTCGMCIWLLCIVPYDYSASFKTDVIIVSTHSQIVNLSIVNRALVILNNMHGSSTYLQFVRIFSIVFNSNDLISQGI